jgi:hypothetical protein
MSRPSLPPFALDAAVQKVRLADSKTYASDVAFTETVKSIQARKGSRSAYARMEAGGSWKQTITPDLKAEIEAQTSVFLATANNSGQPYIQHRGGPAGFLKVLDDQTIGFADFAGNRRQSPVHHAGQPGGQPEGATLPDRLCQAAPHQGLGHGARGGRR